jgi:hypothetical protein
MTAYRRSMAWPGAPGSAARELPTSCSETGAAESWRSPRRPFPRRAGQVSQKFA